MKDDLAASIGSGQSASDTQSSVQTDALLTGKTLEIYKYIITKRKPVGPRELQRAFKLSSSGVATFHLDKLHRNGLITKNENDGTYTVSRVYLKHFFLLRSYLVPRYILYAVMFTSISLGWSVALYFGAGSLLSSPLVFYVFLYGVMTSILASGVFWYESFRVLKKEAI